MAAVAGTGDHETGRRVSTRSRMRWLYCFQRGGGADEESQSFIQAQNRSNKITEDAPAENIVQEIGLLLQILGKKELPPKGEPAAKAMEQAYKELEAAFGSRISNASGRISEASTCTGSDFATCTGSRLSSVSRESKPDSWTGSASSSRPHSRSGAEEHAEEVGLATVPEEKTETKKQVTPPSKPETSELGRPHPIQPLNELIKALWPRIEVHVENMIHNSIEPSINESLPGLVKQSGGVKFTKVSLGDSTPNLGPLSVEHVKENGNIILDLGVDVECDLDIELTAMHIPIGVTKFSLKGDLVVFLSPPMNRPPFFGGIQVYFLNPPEVDIRFAGAARVADVPGLSGAIRGAIGSAVNGKCVIPRRIAIDLDEDDEVDAVDLQYPEPMGVLRFTLFAGSNLVASDISFMGTKSSDPYVVASLGVQSWTSPMISKNLNPVWGDGNGLTTDLLVHDDYQKLMLKVYDYDFGTSDDLIGQFSENVHELIKKQPQSIDLLTCNKEEGAGSLSISASFLSLTKVRPTAPIAASGPSQTYFSARVVTVTGLELGEAFPFKVHVRVFQPPSDDGKDQPKPKGGFLSRLSVGFKSEPTDHVFAEATTQPSHVNPVKELAEAFQGIAVNLSQKGNSPKYIAEILEVGVPQVRRFLNEKEEAEHDSERAMKERKKAELDRLNVKKPRFDEVLDLLLPSEALDERSAVTLTVLDKNQKTLATARVAVKDLLEAPDFESQGSFPTDKEGVSVVGRLRLRWLAGGHLPAWSQEKEAESDAMVADID